MRSAATNLSIVYVSNLERRIAYLESKLRENGIHDLDGESTEELTSPHPTPSDFRPETLPPSLAADESVQLARTSLSPGSKAAVDGVVDLARSEPGQELSFTQVLLTELMHSAGSSKVKRPESVATETQNHADIAAELDSSVISLPARDTAQSLAKAYFQLTSMNLPLLHEPTFQLQLDLVYRMPRAAHLSALVESQSDAKSRMAIFLSPGGLCHRYHETALSALTMTTDVEGVQALLLIAQYSYHHPTFGATWRTVGAAMRLAVELGLHQDGPEGLDALTLDVRRRNFWVAYSMDRNLCTAMSLPSCLSDGAISTQFPSEAADEVITPEGIALATISSSKRVALHMFRYRQIQSELRHMLWERAPPCSQIDIGEWQRQMRERIDNWYSDTPFSSSLGSFEKGVLETLEVTHSTALFHLYRQSPNTPTPSGEQAVAMAQAAIKMIQLYQRFFRRHMLTIYWRSIENIFSAGTALMLGYTQLPEVRDTITFHFLESLIHTCSSLLWGMVERFPSFQGKRDAFDIAASKLMEEFKAGPSEAAAASTVISTSNNVEFGSQVDEAAAEDRTFILGATEEQTWFQFWTPDDFILHPDQVPLMQDLDIAALLGNSTTGDRDVFSST
ncbi:hypothetical protein NM208_g5502 [Fusarium decemcellulare]|uniref:Uncharacterized protein n=1 Tax=Fusarium decemcellulare TaxID=57161 RepID=A0ACC1SGZ4_9HYPO|nr:hypothetical protein NM208_g5502 [Fusarium decemcellulare]